MDIPVILDGGFSTELGLLGFDIDSDPLWGAGALKSNADTVLQVYRNYVSAGCDIITSSSYQASIEGFVQHLGVNADDAEELIGKSVKLARQAVEEQKRHTLVAGSVGPYGATLHDGSEYTGKYVDQPEWNLQTLRDWHKGRVRALLEAGADILAFETQPALEEALALMSLLREFPNAKAWLSFSCSNDGQSTAHGELYKEAVKQCLQQPSYSQLVAVGINCCSPDVVSPLLKLAAEANKERGLSPLPLIVYPNSGEEFIPRVGWKSRQNVSHISEYSQEWFNAGARWLGGCCRTGPKDVVLIREALSKLCTTY